MIRYKPRGQYSGVMDEHKYGPFVLHVAAQAEIDALHAECDRLTAMLGPQKPMKAEEMTEPGFYWQRDDDNCEWGENYSRNVCASYQDDLDHRGYACISRHESATNMPMTFNAALEIVPEREGNRLNRKRVQRVPNFT